MSDQYIGEIRAFGFNFAPTGWALCAGQILPISANAALFSLLGTNFGGNGTSNFGLPNLIGNVPMHWGTGQSTYAIGETTGSTTETINSSQMPLHNHAVQAAESNTLKTGTPGPTAWLGLATEALMYVNSNTSNTTLAPNAIGPNAGGSVPHENMQPYLTINFCIALTGAFPPRG
jgi:microcystin-dependent protein